MIKGKLKNGFSFKADERALSDWRFVRAIADTKSPDDVTRVRAVTQIVRMVLGEDGEEALIKHIEKDNDGYCPATDMEQSAIEIIQIMGDKVAEAKKSTPSQE